MCYAINQNLNGENGFPKKIIYNSALVKILLNFFKFKIFKYLIISGGETKFSRLNDFISIYGLELILTLMLI